jgi:hypothetical protein
MSKTQIIAKSILTVLGIYALMLIPKGIGSTITLYFSQSIPAALFTLAGFGFFTFVAVYFLAFNNNGIARLIAGTSVQLNPQQQTAWLINSLRLGLVFAGLMLIPSTLPALSKLLHFFFLIRPAVNELLTSKGLLSALNLTASQWFGTICDFAALALAAYLILGAPHYIKRQIKITKGAYNE